MTSSSPGADGELALSPRSGRSKRPWIRAGALVVAVVIGVIIAIVVSAIVGEVSKARAMIAAYDRAFGNRWFGVEHVKINGRHLKVA
jgi:hypothetical protein